MKPADRNASLPDSKRQGGGRKQASKTVLVVALAALVLACSGFSALGIWQLYRLQWKLALIERVDTRIHATPVSPPAKSAWPAISKQDDEYRHVLLAGRYLGNHDSLVKAVTELGPGYWLLTPFQLSDGSIVLVESVEAAGQLDFPPDAKLAYLTQTTLSVDDANRIIQRLKQRFGQLVGPPKEDICYATQNRQEAVRVLADEANVVLVLGSQNSSNSQRLKEIAHERNIPAYLVDGAGDIDPAWFRGDETVLVTAGASAPESVVEECVEFLKSRFGADVEARTLRREDVHFPLPRELRPLAKA